MPRLSIRGGGTTAAPAAAAAVVPAAEGHKGGRGSKGGMAPLTTLWSDLVRRKSSKGKLVRYDHPPTPTEVRPHIPYSGQFLCL
jgi:hypothetical protein